MAEQRSAAEWAEYYQARLTFLREQVQLGLPLNDQEGRQTVLDFAEHWQASHRPEGQDNSLADLQARMQTLTPETQGQKQGVKY